MKVRITTDHEAASSALPGTYEIRNGRRIRPVGMIIEGPQVYRLVRVGLADPADDECMAMFSADQIAEFKSVGHPYLMANHAREVQSARDAETGGFIEESDE